VIQGEGLGPISKGPNLKLDRVVKMIVNPVLLGSGSACEKEGEGSTCSLNQASKDITPDSQQTP